ncbi:MAG: hypothetical protein Tsb002_10660 [Wenzhouxiangellaceae bacterium]
MVKSEIVVQHYGMNPYDFLLAEYAVDYPFAYSEEDTILLSPYMQLTDPAEDSLLGCWLNDLWRFGEKVQTLELLHGLNQHIYQSLTYQKRDTEGVQHVDKTLSSGVGSCRDYAALFIVAARRLGFAVRFVSGYLYSGMPENQPGESGSTHAWVEVFIPGAGWKGFDPSVNIIVGAGHVPVAVARRPESVPPISGSYGGISGAEMTVKVKVAALN